MFALISWLLSVLTAAVRWAHLTLLEPVASWWEWVLQLWEEWWVVLVRQAFEETARFVNGVAAACVSLFNPNYRESLRSAWRKDQEEWQHWWREVAARPSTLNALVATLQQQQQQQNSIASPDAAFTDLDATTARAAAASGLNGAGPSQSPPSHPAGPGSGPAAAPRSPWRWNRTSEQHKAPQDVTQQGVWGGAGSAAALRRAAHNTAAQLQRPVMFVQQSGMGIIEAAAASMKRRGLLEDARLATELAVTRAFGAARRALRAALLLPQRPSQMHVHAAQDAGVFGWPGPGAAAPTAAPPLVRSRSAHITFEDDDLGLQSGAGAGEHVGAGGGSTVSVDDAGRTLHSGGRTGQGIRRVRSFSRLHDHGTAAAAMSTGASRARAKPSAAQPRPPCAAEVIRAAGYPLQVYDVATPDGYVLTMERIPRPGCRDVVFFMHGVLDTSLAWVASGVTGSQAFAAWEAGFDVWLGNSRGNAPRRHQDPSRRGAAYWRYNVNHMAMHDLAAQLDHVHNVKCAELGAGTVSLDLNCLGPAARGLFAAGAAAAARGGGGWGHCHHWPCVGGGG